MSGIKIGTVKTLPEYERADKAQAAKVLEEAAEVFAAWQDYERAQENMESTGCQTHKKVALLYECADAIIAICHLLAGLGVVNVKGIIANKLRIVESRLSRDLRGEGES